MPTEAEHKSASERHLIAYRDTVEQHPDWAAVMLFYCAVQACEMLFARDGHHSVDHGQRDFRLKSQYASLWPHYRRLKSESLKTRYLEGGAFRMTADRVKAALHDGALTRLLEDVNSRVQARGLGIKPPGG